MCSVFMCERGGDIGVILFSRVCVRLQAGINVLIKRIKWINDPFSQREKDCHRIVLRRVYVGLQMTMCELIGLFLKCIESSFRFECYF